MQWVFETYGRDHAALCSTVIRYRSKGALRDVGKALGLPEDMTKQLSSSVWGWGEDIGAKHAAELNLNLGDRRLRLALELAQQLIGAPRHLSQHPGGFVLTDDRLDELVPIEPAAMADRQVIEWDKDDIDILKFMKVDCLALGMLSCMKRGFDLLARPQGRRPRSRHHPGRGPAHLRDDPQGRHARHLPDREPGADGDAAAHQAAHLLRSRHRGRHRAARPDPGRHGASLPAPARGQGGGRLPDARTGEGARQDPRRAAVPGAGDAGRHRMRRLHRRRGGSAAPRHGDLQVHRRGQPVPRQADRRHGGARLRARLRRAHLRAAGGLRQLRLSREPRRLLRADRLRQQLAQVLASGRVLRGAAQRPADGLLRARADRARRPRPRRRGPPDLRQRQPLGLHAGADATRPTASRCGSGCAWSGGSPTPMPPRSSAPAPTGPSPSVDDLWRRAGVPAAALVRLAEADAFRPALGLARREALWAIKALRDEPLAAVRRRRRRARPTRWRKPTSPPSRSGR